MSFSVTGPSLLSPYGPLRTFCVSVWNLLPWCGNHVANAEQDVCSYSTLCWHQRVIEVKDIALILALTSCPKLLSADLDQAIQKAMQAIGQEPVPLTKYVQLPDRESQLLQRIAALEKQLQQQPQQ